MAMPTRSRTFCVRARQYWLPRELARRHAAVLAAMLNQAAEFGELQRRGQETNEALEDTRRQVSRLVNLLWEAVPGEGRRAGSRSATCWSGWKRK